MKKIDLWVVFLLNLVTLGIYSLFWSIKRRSEMIAVYDRKIPHWLWLFVPFLALIAMAAVLLFAFATYDNNTGVSAIFVITAIVGMVSILASLVITIWWSWKLFKAAEYINRGQAPARWILAIAIFAAPLHTLFLQYYFNRAESPEKIPTLPKVKPTRNFVLLAIVAIIVGICFGNNNLNKAIEDSDDSYGKDSSSQYEYDY